MTNELGKILLSVQNPARYIGGETGTPTIDENARVKFCLLSTDLYESAMNDYKIKTIYHKVNDRKGNSAERCFAPWLDLGSQIKKAGIKLFSLENKKPLCEFDLLGVHLHYPSQYTTLLYMLSLGGVTIETKSRNDSSPFVFGFGEACINPEVVSSFLDFVIIGDAEEVVLSVIDCLKSAKTNKFDRNQTLLELAKIQGVYVPSINYRTLDKKGRVVWTHDKVKKAVAIDLDRNYYPTVIQVPNIRQTRECVCVEPIRGCTRGCRFCLYGFLNRPIRERRIANISAHANSQVTSTGIKAIDFSSRCFGDYTKLNALVSELNDIEKEKDVKVIIPEFSGSENYSDFVTLESHDTVKVKIEAGTEQLRNKINKILSDRKIDEALELVYKAGYSCVKLNFMIGLPFETGNDLLGIIETVKRAKMLYRKHKSTSKPVYITCTISCFVPKPFTPFEWCESISLEQAEKRFKFIKKGLKGLGVRVKLFSPEYTLIESVLSRGDKRVSDAVILAYKYGAVFDRNSKLFNYNAYSKAFSALGIDVNKEIAHKDTNTIFPWDNVDMFVDKSYLLAEYEKAKKGIVTPDCRNGCASCGLSQKGVCKHGRL